MGHVGPGQMDLALWPGLSVSFKCTGRNKKNVLGTTATDDVLYDTVCNIRR